MVQVRFEGRLMVSDQRSQQAIHTDLLQYHTFRGGRILFVPKVKLTDASLIYIWYLYGIGGSE